MKTEMIKIDRDDMDLREMKRAGEILKKGGLVEAEAYWRIYADEFDMILMTDDGTVYVTEGIRDRFRTKGKMEVLYREEP